MPNLIDLGQRSDGTHVMIHPLDSGETLEDFLKKELEKNPPKETRENISKTLKTIQQ